MNIILTADDLGKSPARNDAIIESFRMGYISSAGIIVTGVHLQDAVKKMEENNIDWSKVHLHMLFATNILKEGSDDCPLTERMRKDAFFCYQNGKYKCQKNSILPIRFKSVSRWRTAYLEMVAQYNKFREISKGKGDFEHIDCHLWFNFTWPVAFALNVFTWTHKIKSVRYWALHHQEDSELRMLRVVMRNPFVRYIPATNIDYFVSKREECEKYNTMELYCHPNYKDGILLDDSPSYIDKTRERLSVPNQIELLKDSVSYNLITWHDI